MNNTESFHILYVGRNTKLIDTIRTLLAQPSTIHNLPNPGLHTPHYQNGATSSEADEEKLPAKGLENMTLAVAVNQKSAYEILRVEPPHIILVEIDGRPNSRTLFCKKLRTRLPTVKILAVYDKHNVPQTKFKFDGFIEYPKSIDDVHKTLLDASANSIEYAIERGPIYLNTAKRTVRTARGVYHMTPKQCLLLHLLMSRRNTVVTRNDIMQKVWDTDFLDDTRTMDVHIRWLRECIEPDPSAPTYLLTKRGVGYYLQIAEEE